MKNQSSTFTGAGHVSQTDRLYYLDWLRVFAILAILFHHCSKIFDYHTTDLFNSIRSFAPSIHREFEALWIMPLFFVISGASVHYSLKSRKAGGFIKERILRIAIPLVFIGTFIIAPPQIYVMRFFHGHFSGNFIEWYHSHYFNGVWPIGNFNPFGLGTHLWYLFFLFLFSLILLPLFIPFKNTGKSAISRISYLFVNPWALFLLFLPVSAASALFEAMGLGVVRIAGHWDQISFLLFFGYGYLIFCNSRIQETIRKYSTTFLVVALIFTALYLDSHFGVFLKISGVTEHNLLENSITLPQNHSVWIAVQAFRGLLAWCWIIGLLGLARRFLNFNNRFLVYANEAVLPFYILHHTIIYIIGFFIVQWSSGVGTKYFSIAIVSFTVIMVIYEILVRRVNILRILFGMKSKKDFKNQQTALCVTAGLFFVLVMALVVVSLNRVNISPPPTKPGSYVNKEFGFQLTFPTSMNKPGKLTPYDVLFHIKHPEKTLYLKVRKNAIPSNQPLDPYVGKKWIKMIMVSLGMKYPEVLSTEIFTTPDGTKALYAAIKFKTRSQTSLVGTFAFVDKKGKRLFIAGYSDNGFGSLEQIMKSLTFK